MSFRLVKFNTLQQNLLWQFDTVMVNNPPTHMFNTEYTKLQRKKWSMLHIKKKKTCSMAKGLLRTHLSSQLTSFW